MRALVAAPGGKLRWREAPAPPPPDRGAVVHPIAASTCDMDCPLDVGRHPDAAATAPRARMCRRDPQRRRPGCDGPPGDRVIVPFKSTAGPVPPVLRAHRRLQGCSADFHVRLRLRRRGHWGGAFADQLAVPFADAMLVALPDGIDPAAAASVADNVCDALPPHRPPPARSARQRPVGKGAGSRQGGQALAVHPELPPQYAGLIARAMGAQTVYFAIPQERPCTRRSGLGMETVHPRDLRRMAPFPLVADVSATGLRTALQSTAPDGICSSSGGLHRQARIRSCRCNPNPPTLAVLATPACSSVTPAACPRCTTVAALRAPRVLGALRRERQTVLVARPVSSPIFARFGGGTVCLRNGFREAGDGEGPLRPLRRSGRRLPAGLRARRGPEDRALPRRPDHADARRRSTSRPASCSAASPASWACASSSRSAATELVVTSDKDGPDSSFERELPGRRRRHLTALLARLPDRRADRQGAEPEAGDDRRDRLRPRRPAGGDRARHHRRRGHLLQQHQRRRARRDDDPGAGPQLHPLLPVGGRRRLEHRRLRLALLRPRGHAGRHGRRRADRLGGAAAAEALRRRPALHRPPPPAARGRGGAGRHLPPRRRVAGRGLRRGHDQRAAAPGDREPLRRGADRQDEARRLPDQHRARQDLRPRRGRARAARAASSPATPATSGSRSRRPATTPGGRCPTTA